MTQGTPSRDVECRLCGSVGTRDVVAERMLSLPSDLPQRVYACGACRFRWMAPIPSREELQALYGKSYFDEFSYDQQVAGLEPCLIEHAQTMKSLAPVIRVLDVGCATGEFVSTARAAGLDAMGVEPSDYAVGIARKRGLPVFQGDVFDARLAPGTYGGLFVSHVLEHIPDPLAAIDRFRDLLVPHGVLYVEVPYQFEGLTELKRRATGEFPAFGAWSLHHCSFFTPSSLVRLLESKGFETTSLTTHLPCRRQTRKPGLRRSILQGALWMADRLARRGDIISVWARAGR